MNSHIEIQIPGSAWLKEVQEIAHLHSIQSFKAQDATRTSILIEWNKADILSPELAAFKKNISTLAAQAIAPEEVQFLRAYPHAVSQELFLRSCAPLFENGLAAVEWDKVEESIQATIKQFYTIDLASFGPDIIKPLLHDIYFFATAKEKDTQQMLGFILFSVTPALPYGDIKIISVAVDPSKKERGVELLLISSIFKIIPQTQRLFLFVRPTNKQAIEMYDSFGFTQDLEPLEDPNHKVNMENLMLLEYKVNRASTLQDFAKTLFP